MKYFVYDSQDGLEEFETEAEMKERIESLIEGYKEIAILEGEWPEEIELIRYGRLDGYVKLCDAPFYADAVMADI